MSNNYLDKSCTNCRFYNPNEAPLYCDFTLDPTVSPVRCSILKENVKKIKLKEKLM